MHVAVRLADAGSRKRVRVVGTPAAHTQQGATAGRHQRQMALRLPQLSLNAPPPAEPPTQSAHSESASLCGACCLGKYNPAGSHAHTCLNAVGVWKRAQSERKRQAVQQCGRRRDQRLKWQCPLFRWWLVAVRLHRDCFCANQAGAASLPHDLNGAVGEAVATRPHRRDAHRVGVARRLVSALRHPFHMQRVAARRQAGHGHLSIAELLHGQEWK
jgi:hypothetical protein